MVEPRLVVIANNTNVDLTYYRWVNPLFGDNYAVTFKTIHPGETVQDFIWNTDFNQADRVKDENGNYLLVNGHEVTRFLIVKCSDVGAFYDVVKGAKTFEATVYFDKAYSRITITGFASNGKMLGTISYRDELPEFTPGITPDSGYDASDDSGMTTDSSLGQSTTGNPTDRDPWEEWIPYIIIGGLGLFALLFLVLLLRR